MDWGNVFINKIHKEGNEIKSIEIRLNLNGDFKKTKKKITWLSRVGTKNISVPHVELLLLDYDYLITKRRLEEDDNVEDCVTPVTEFRVFFFLFLSLSFFFDFV